MSNQSTAECGARAVIQFRHGRPYVLGEGKGTALAVQALRYIGKEHLDEQSILRLRTLLSDAEKRRVLKATRFGIEWIYEAAKKIAKKPA